MNILIAGGTGFIGTALTKSLERDNHKVHILTRRKPVNSNQVQWDGKTTKGWRHIVNDMDAVVNLTGYGLEHWPWTKRQKQKFIDSRVIPGLALASAVKDASPRPGIFLQASGINRYGLRNEGIADESTPPADDFLAQITVGWEGATESVEELGVRRVITRNAIVLARRGGLLPLMALPVRLFFGGRFGDGTQATPWIHIDDHIAAMRFLLENETAHGPFNLIAPTPTSNAEFMRILARQLHRPYWFHLPTFLLRIPLGEMSVLLTEGSYSQPKHLIELGYNFQFPNLEGAIRDLFK
ncbi:MAG TPA: TIGR01777 family oxidoreductase [Anaerolineales bacterium]|nr:TIGR01777 family oxidoreductase [Anaerolineales bacterium]